MSSKKSEKNKKSQIRVRIAPSPTGLFHIGTARTALFNFLFAKKNGGQFILRIEDTDKKRSQKYFEQDIIDNLDWLGLKRDEGPIVGGEYGPYKQSERKELYKKHIDKLLKEGKAFYCFSQERNQDREKSKKEVFWSPDRDLSPKEADKKVKAGMPYIIRFKTPKNKKISFKDLIRKEVAFETNIIGDFSIAKNINEPLYNFAAVVDDYNMKISHVIRGEDHISNTPKQILLQNAMGFKSPKYAHLPLILGPDKTKLSKRHNTVSLKDYKKDGYLPEAIVNFMALLGWNPGTDQEIFSMSQLIDSFSLNKVQLSGAVFNLNKLDWMNGSYIRSLPEKTYVQLALPYLEKHKVSKKDLEKVVLVSRGRLKKLSDLKRDTNFFFEEPDYDTSLLYWKKMTKKDVYKSLEEARQQIKSLKKEQLKKENIEIIFLKKAKEINDKDLGFFLWPLRAALTGVSASPGPFEMITVLGKEESLLRVTRALNKVKKSKE